jgi:1-acyl-sn-glycerol-3-phosphate acyltransferase
VTLRAFQRAVALGLVLAGCIFRYWRVRLHGPLTPGQRALWLQNSCRKALACLGIECGVEGSPPTRGLVVANHLSYLDIAVLAAAMPCCFVAKSEIANWPFIGAAARASGTIFLERASRTSSRVVADAIGQRLSLPVPVLLFPEGTTTDGSTVLRFHSRLLAPAVETHAPVTAVALRYSAGGAAEERALCWYGDAIFLPHLWKTLGIAGIRAELRFGLPRLYSDRLTAAKETQAEVATLRAQGALQPRAAV